MKKTALLALAVILAGTLWGCAGGEEADKTAPTISGVLTSGITPTSATITWTTDEPATGQVQYGLTTSYGSTTTLDATLVSSHSVSLSDLSPGTTYHYRVISKDAAQNEAASEDDAFTTMSPRVGFEILEIQSPNSIRAWISSDITQEEFDALELPAGWFKNQPREGDPDASRFYRSPGAAVEGEFLEEELFGFSWWHSATVIEPNVPLDGQGLLRGSTVTKFHEVTYDAGTTVFVLFSPEGDPYVRIGRDANRTSDDPTIPNSWRLVEYTTPDQLVIQLPEETLVIRADNEDSFQGPVPELAVAL